MNSNTQKAEMWQTLKPEVKWAIWTLKSNDIRPGQYMDLMPFAVNMEQQYKAIIEEVNKGTKNRYERLAAQLREMWPIGDKVIEKDGNISRVAWRDSVSNLSKRIKKLSETRHIEQFSDEQIIRCARIYLAEHAENNKYMKVLKYFIFNERTGESKLADKLDTITDAENLFAEPQMEYDITNVDYGETLG